MSKDQRRLNEILSGFLQGYQSERDRRDKLKQDDRRTENDYNLFVRKAMFENQLNQEQSNRDNEIMSQITNKFGNSLLNSQESENNIEANNIPEKISTSYGVDIPRSALSDPNQYMKNLTPDRSAYEEGIKNYSPQEISELKEYDGLIKLNDAQINNLLPQKQMYEEMLNSRITNEKKEIAEKKLNHINTKIENYQNKIEEYRIKRKTRDTDFSKELAKKNGANGEYVNIGGKPQFLTGHELEAYKKAPAEITNPTVTSATKEFQLKNLKFAGKAAIANQDLNEIDKTTDYTKFWGHTSERMYQKGLGRISEDLADFKKSDKMKKFDSATWQFLNTVLRDESGAAILTSEYSKYYSIYIPQSGDKPDQIARKKRNRELAVRGFELANTSGDWKNNMPHLGGGGVELPSDGFSIPRAFKKDPIEFLKGLKK